MTVRIVGPGMISRIADAATYASQSSMGIDNSLSLMEAGRPFLRGVREASAWLQAIGDQHAPLGADRCLAVATLHTPAQLDDRTTELFVARDLDHQPLETNRLVGVDRAAEADPELQPHHRALLRE